MWLHGRTLRDDGKEHGNNYIIIGYIWGLDGDNGKYNWNY